jgi:cortactin
MWKYTTTSIPSTSLNNNIKATKTNKANEDDWETDPDFVNSVSEKEQRWGQKPNQETPKTNLNLTELRQQVLLQNEETSKKTWETLKGKDVKQSYGVKKS